MITPIQLFKCLSDETRLNATLLIFREEELCVCELMEALADSQPKISRHLAQLRQNGLLKDQRKGQWVFYRLHPELPQWALHIIESTAQSQGLELAQFQQKLRYMNNRPVCC